MDLPNPRVEAEYRSEMASDKTSYQSISEVFKRKEAKHKDGTEGIRNASHHEIKEISSNSTDQEPDEKQTGVT